MYDFILPDVGEGIFEAELLEWTVQEGDTVDEGDTVAVVNTDKVTAELPSPVSGIVTVLAWRPGDIVRVGEVLMSFAADGSQSDSMPVVEAELQSDGARGRPAPSQSISQRLGRPVAAPSTRKLASELGVDLSFLAGTGPGGRILRSDVDAVAVARSARRLDTSASPGSTAVSDEITREPLTGVRAVIWRHMTESSTMLATTTTTFTVRMEEVESVLEELSSASSREEQPKLGVLAMASFCIARALRANGRFNATFDADSGDLLIHSGVHLGIAVASPNGLMVPVLRDADRLRLTELNLAVHELTGRARDGLIGIEDLRGGTFSISSTGGLQRSRIVSTQPIVNLPQVALLWMSRVRDEPVVDGGSVRAGRVMTCSLSFDHRYIDGADATHFINEISDLIEHPVRVLS